MDLEGPGEVQKGDQVVQAVAQEKKAVVEGSMKGKLNLTRIRTTRL